MIWNLVRIGAALLFISADPLFGSLSFHDPFPGTNGDVIGDPRSFDIQFANVSITRSSLTIEITLNFGLPGQSNVDAFRYDWSPWLSIGDILFLENGIPRWGAPVADHAGSINGGPSSNLLFAGQMYSVNNENGWFTARQALQDSTNYYRYDSPVWLRDTAGSLAAVGTAGFVNVSYLGGDGTVTPRFRVSLTVATPADLFASWQSGLLSFSFASASCGNDIISGMLDPQLDLSPPTPEPSSLLLAATGLLAVIALRRRARVTPIQPARAMRWDPDPAP